MFTYFITQAFGTPPRIRTETEPLLRRFSLPVGIEEHGTQGEIRTHKLPLLRRHCLPLQHLRIFGGQGRNCTSVVSMYLIYSQGPSLLGIPTHVWWLELRSNQLLRFFRPSLYHISYLTMLVPCEGLEPPATIL